MKTLLRYLSVLMLIGVLSACSNTPIIKSDYDVNANFASYRTYSFMEPLSTDRAGYTTLLTERLKRAANFQMESRGYVYSPVEPDLLVNFQSHISNRSEYVQPPPPMMMWGFNSFGYQGNLYNNWPGYAFGPSVIQYSEGVLHVDLIDAKRRQLVWEGTGSSVLGNVQTAASSNAIDSLMSAIFARFPFVAGVNAKPKP